MIKLCMYIHMKSSSYEMKLQARKISVNFLGLKFEESRNTNIGLDFGDSLRRN